MIDGAGTFVRGRNCNRKSDEQRSKVRRNSKVAVDEVMTDKRMMENKMAGNQKMRFLVFVL